MPLRVLSLGAGVQSTTVALLALDGHLPPIQHAIFADTGWEPEAVYQHLARLRKVLERGGVQVHTVSYGNLRDDALDSNVRVTIPLYSLKQRGDRTQRGMLGRQCTSNYKLRPIHTKIRELLGARVWIDRSGKRRVGRVTGPWGETYAEVYIGISTDEIERIKPSDVRYVKRVDPLVEIVGMSRTDCEEFLSYRWPEPVPRSSCIGCPFRTNHDWRILRDQYPAEWANAVDFDRRIRDFTRTFNPRKDIDSAETFLHADRVPLDQADIDRDPSQRVRGSCSPFGCSEEGK